MKLTMDRVVQEKMTNVEFQMDNKDLVNIMKDSEDNIPKNTTIMHCREMWKMKTKFEKMQIEHIRREKNTTSHFLARVRVTKGLTNKTQENNPEFKKTGLKPIYFVVFVVLRTILVLKNTHLGRL